MNQLLAVTTLVPVTHALLGNLEFKAQQATTEKLKCWTSKNNTHESRAESNDDIYYNV